MGKASHSELLTTPSRAEQVRANARLPSLGRESKKNKAPYHKCIQLPQECLSYTHIQTSDF